MKPSNFPMKTVDEILQEYNVYYDFSCGWGVRMLSAMKNGITYYGTDPNKYLIDRLHLIKDRYDLVNGGSSNVNLYCQGSEEFIPELENKVGLAFSSPPYFHLEDYKVGNQSYLKGMEYSDWLDGYMLDTILNIKDYLIDDGYFLINVKNYSDFLLYDDIKKMCIDSGFFFIKNIQLENITRPSAKVGLDTSEKIMIFSKVEKSQWKQTDLFSFM